MKIDNASRLSRNIFETSIQCDNTGHNTFEGSWQIEGVSGSSSQNLSNPIFATWKLYNIHPSHVISITCRCDAYSAEFRAINVTKNVKIKKYFL